MDSHAYLYSNRISISIIRNVSKLEFEDCIDKLHTKVKTTKKIKDKITLMI